MTSPSDFEDGVGGGYDDGVYDFDTQPIRRDRYAGPRLVRPFSVEEETAQRAANPEWIGAFPFLALVGWWAM